MEHVVFYPGTDGGAAFRRLPSLDEAVSLVEHLRNVEGVERLSVHALTEVPLSFRAYYHVEVPAPGSELPASEAAAPAPVEPLDAEVIPLVEPLLDSDEDEEGAEGAEAAEPAEDAATDVPAPRREGLRGVGFFA